MKERIGLAVAEYNSEITSKMSSIAQEHAKKLGAVIERVINVPGVYEIPYAVSMLVRDSKIDGVVTIGAVIKGDTNHDEVIAHSVSRKLLDISIESEKPVSLGITGPGVTREQAIKRIESYAMHSVETVVKMLRCFHK